MNIKKLNIKLNVQKKNKINFYYKNNKQNNKNYNQNNK